MPSFRSPPTTRATAIAALVTTAVACAPADDASRSAVTVDTLPNGAVRTLSSTPADSGRWAFELLHEIQPPEGDSVELLRPTDVTIADDGSVLVAEGTPAHVKVFGPDGRFRRRIGREGEGPGEFRVAFITTRGDSLYVQDPQVARGSTFLISTGAFVASRHTACCYWSAIGVDGAGRVVLPSLRAERDTSEGASMHFVRAAFAGDASDTVRVALTRTSSPPRLWQVRDGGTLRMTVAVPLEPRDVQAVDPRGGFITAWTGEYLLRTTRDGADTVALHGRAFAPTSVTPAEKQALVDARIARMTAQPGPGTVPEPVLRDAFDVDLIPDVRPPFENFHVDRAGRTWVRRSFADTSRVEFDLFGADGVWLDVVRGDGGVWPSSPWAPLGWGADRVAVPGEDADGRPIVRVYAIVRRP